MLFFLRIIVTVFLLSSLQKQRASQAIFVLAFHAGTETSPRTLYLHATAMRGLQTRTSYLSQS